MTDTLEIKHRWTKFFTVTIGTGPRTLNEFKKAADENLCGVTSDAWAMFEAGKIPITNQKVRLNLVSLSLEELGLMRQNCFCEGDGLREGLKHGLKACPAEVAYQLAGQLKPLTNFMIRNYHVIATPQLMWEGRERMFAIGYHAHTLRMGDTWTFGRGDRPLQEFRFLFVHPETTN